MLKGLKVSPLFLAAVAFVVLVIYLYLPKEQIVKMKSEGLTPVTVHTIKIEAFPVTVEALGTAKANESVLLTAQTTDIVQSINFDDGDVVKQGQILIQLNDNEEKARFNELDINLQEAKRQLKRITNLAKESAASEQLLDEQQAKVKAIKAQMDVVNSQLDELQLRAPFDGVLGIRQISVGALLKPGDLVTTLDDIALVKLDFSISEAHLPSVAIGQQISATSVAYPDEVFTGKIASIASRVDPITRSIPIRANINNKQLKLRPGMLMQVELQKLMLETLVLPEHSLVPVEDKQFVFVIVDGVAKRQQVEVGRRRPGFVQIISGLEVGDQVVVEGTLRLRDGSKIRILDSAKKEG
ncbi:efflux RND transporter periplasmic adaptor subunit [Paraglaciecola hydrolytica]|uniref:Efflux transporter periplasmic adaptor subunit n=1 Tax=Paraglaciecola hydrolytica TaxID=1799789 RepID=A0A136A018_9ALTE|nr:efflux RND transporter periplasmic adaptor subunit [Paraglaciecola hydrolytica]KXI28598.1 efflux transporter periplasmic adaptor subunit [Paraglaciecola hydrolytica]